MKTISKEITLVGATGVGDAIGSERFGVNAPAKLMGIQVQWVSQSSGTAVLTLTSILNGLSKVIYDGSVWNDTDLPLTALSELVMQYDGTIGTQESPPILAGELLLDVVSADDGACVVSLLLQP